MQAYPEDQQSLSVLLEQASRKGEVRIQRADGQIFVLKREDSGTSPLDVRGVALGISPKEIVEFIHEGRKRI